MKTFRFNHYGKAGPDELFYITTPAESDVYVLKTEADAEIQQVKADWVERCKKFRKKDADEHEAETAALRERQRVLVEIAQLLVDHAQNADQELWASLPDVIALQDAIERTP